MKSIPLTDDLYDYLLGVSLVDNPTLQELRNVTREMPAGGMQIAPEQGQFMQFLARLVHAEQYLEVGCFTGYSSLAMALVLPDWGKVVTCDVSQEWTDIARRHWQQAGVAHKIDLRLGPAAETLQAMLADGHGGTFDIAFIDADKDNYVKYYELCLDLVRTDGLLLIDNSLWAGKVADPSVMDMDTQGIRAVNQRAYEDLRVNSCLLPISDGLHLCHKL